MKYITLRERLEGKDERFFNKNNRRMSEMAKIIRGGEGSDSTHFSSEYNKLLSEFKGSKMYKWLEFFNRYHWKTSFEPCNLYELPDDLKSLANMNYLIYELDKYYLIFFKYPSYDFGLVSIISNSYYTTLEDGRSVDFYIRVLQSFINEGKVSLYNSYFLPLDYKKLKQDITKIKHVFLTDYTLENILDDREEFIIDNILKSRDKNETISFYDDPSLTRLKIYRGKDDEITLEGEYNKPMTCDEFVVFSDGLRLNYLNINVTKNEKKLYREQFDFSFNSNWGNKWGKYNNITINKLDIDIRSMFLFYNITSSEININGKDTFLLTNSKPKSRNIKSDTEIELYVNGSVYTVYCNNGFYNRYESMLNDESIDDAKILNDICNTYFHFNPED